MQIPIIQGSKVDTDDSHTITTYPVNTYAKDGKMRSIYGLRLFSDLNHKDRNGYFINTGQIKGHFRVAGDQLIEVSRSGAISYPVNNDTKVAGSASNRVKFVATIQNLAFCAGGVYYLYNRNDDLRSVTQTSSDPKLDLGEVLDLVWIKQFVILLALTDVDDGKGGTVKGVAMWQSSPQQDDKFIRGNQIDDSDPDRSVAIASESDFFILFNKKTISFWYPKIADQNKFSFLPAESKQIDGGIVGRDCKAKIGNTWAILSINVPNQDPNIYLLGSVLQPIGSIEIQTILKTYAEAEFSTVVMECHNKDSIDMLYVHLERHVLMYNAQTQLWVILKSIDNKYNEIPYRGINIVNDERTNQLIVGDKYDHILGIRDQTIGHQYNLPITQIMYTYFMPFNQVIRHLIISGNFGQWPKGEEPLIKIQLSQSGIAFGPTLTCYFPESNHYNSLISLRNLGYIKGKATLRIEVNTKYKIELDDKIFINEDADMLINAS